MERHYLRLCTGPIIVCCGASIVAHFASKVSYSASPQTFAECSRSASCCYAVPALFFVLISRGAGAC